MRARDSKRAIKAQKALSGRLDFILDLYETSDFVEITGQAGGDTVTYRVRDDGSISER